MQRVQRKKYNMKNVVIGILVVFVICVGFYLGYRQAVLAKVNPPVQVTPLVIEPEGPQTPLSSVEKEKIINRLKTNSAIIKDGNIEFNVKWTTKGLHISEEQIQEELKGFKESLRNQHQPESLIVQNMKTFETDIRMSNNGSVNKYNLFMSFDESTMRVEENGMVTVDKKLNADNIVLLEPDKFEQFIKLNNYLLRWTDGFDNHVPHFRYWGINKIQNCYADLILTNPDHYEFSKNGIGRIIIKGLIDSSLQSQYYGADSVELELNPNQIFLFNKATFYHNRPEMGSLWYIIKAINIISFNGIQYPNQVECQIFQRDQPSSTYEYSMRRAQFNIPAKSLNLKIKLPIGTQVQDNRFSPPLLYKLNSDKDYTDDELAEMDKKRKIKTNDIIRRQ